MSNTATDIFKILGEFWTRIWKEPKLVDGMGQGLARPFDQLDSQADTLQDYLSRMNIPLTFFRHWEFLEIKEEDLIVEKVKIGDITVGQFSIGDEKVPKSWNITKSLENCSLIVSSPINPSYIWYKGQEFTVNDGKITFYKDPFTVFDTTMTVTAEGEALKKCRIWLSSTETDMSALKDHFGVVFNLNVPSTLFYQRIVNSVWDLRVQGATSRNIRSLLAAMADAEIATGSGTVTETWTENGRAWVAVGNTLYSAASPSESIVSVNDTVNTGDMLFDTFTSYKTTDDIPSAYIPAMQLDSRFANSKYKGGLLFENKEFDLEYIYASGKPGVEVLTQIEGADDSLLIETEYGTQNVLIDDITSLHLYGIVKLPIFPIGGDDASVKQYRYDMAGKAYDLDIDIWGAVTEGQRYPYKINPFDFLVSNIFGSNIFFVKYKAGVISSSAPLQASIFQLVECVPAGSTFLLFLESGSTLMDELKGVATDSQEVISLTGSLDESPTTVSGEKISASPAIF